MNEIINSQRLEIENIYKNNALIKRNIEDEINKYIDQKIVKVIVGPRRCGKSVVGMNLIKNKKYAYFNFDDERVDLEKFDYDNFLAYFLKKDTEILFFDEIQNLPKWELFINRLSRNGYNILLTGSNSNLLSKELGTHLTGRYLQFEMYSFSLDEFLSFNKFDFNLNNFSDGIYKSSFIELYDKYIQNGGFPEIYQKNIPPDYYIKNLVESTITKDIFGRYNIRYQKKIKDILYMIYSNITKEVSYNNIKNTLGLSSVHTVENYIDYLNNVYLLYELPMFSFSAKRQISYNKKYFTFDNGQISHGFNVTQNYGNLFENMIFSHLKRKYKEMYYYKDSNTNKECDFIIKDGLKMKLVIQSCFKINPENRKRELDGLLYAMNKFSHDKGYIVTFDQEENIKNNKKDIQIIPFYKFISLQD